MYKHHWDGHFKVAADENPLQLLNEYSIKNFILC